MGFSVSASLENYLRMILQLQEDVSVVRVTDLAEKLNIAKSSVNQAVKILKKKGLVRHEKYGPLELTERGKTLARGIARRHELILKFLIKVLKVDAATAKNDACLMEHAVSPVTMEKLSDYIEQHLGETLNESQRAIKPDTGVFKKLDTVLPGTRVKVIRLDSKNGTGRRLMEMGITRGTELIVESYAPMGDPINIKIRGYSLAIRKSEARDVYVEVI
jgi:DtxR family transcriptional regulator, Mn-dependent transcriptional regulator